MLPDTLGCSVGADVADVFPKLKFKACVTCLVSLKYYSIGGTIRIRTTIMIIIRTKIIIMIIFMIIIMTMIII